MFSLYHRHLRYCFSSILNCHCSERKVKPGFQRLRKVKLRFWSWQDWFMMDPDSVSDILSRLAVASDEDRRQLLNNIRPALDKQDSRSLLKVTLSPREFNLNGAINAHFIIMRLLAKIKIWNVKLKLCVHLLDWLSFGNVFMIIILN